MKKLAAVIAVLLAVTTSVPTLATATGTATAPIKVREFVTVPVNVHQFKHDHFAGTDKVKSNGNLVGYDSYTGHFNADIDRVAYRASLALRGGVIVVRVTQSASDPRASGPILYGAGKYQGIQGTASVRPAGADRERITLRYTLP